MSDTDKNSQIAADAESASGPSSNAASMAALVVRAQRGDLAAFQDLYSSFGSKILNYVYRLTGSRADAEDITQDTFVLAFRKLSTLQDPARFQGWLYRIAQNSVFQKYRGKKPRIESIDEEDSAELSDVQKLSTHLKSPEESILSAELEELVAKTIRDLPEKYKTVFVLSAIQKLSYQEIAEMLGKSLSAVKSDIHRARVIVRDTIKEYLGEDYGMSKLH